MSAWWNGKCLHLLEFVTVHNTVLRTWRNWECALRPFNFSFVLLLLCVKLSQHNRICANHIGLYGFRSDFSHFSLTLQKALTRKRKKTETNHIPYASTDWSQGLLSKHTKPCLCPWGGRMSIREDTEAGRQEIWVYVLIVANLLGRLAMILDSSETPAVKSSSMKNPLGLLPIWPLPLQSHPEQCEVLANRVGEEMIFSFTFCVPWTTWWQLFSSFRCLDCGL